MTSSTGALASPPDPAPERANPFADPGDAATAADLLRVADVFARAAFTSLPEYDRTLFEANLSNPVDAFGLPIAADMGIGTLLAALEGLSLVEAAGLVS